MTPEQLDEWERVCVEMERVSADPKWVVHTHETVADAIAEDHEAWSWASGAWRAEWGRPSEVWASGEREGYLTGMPGSVTTSEPNARFIALARTALPELIAEVRRRDKLLRRARVELNHMLWCAEREQAPHDGDDFHELLGDTEEWA